MFRVFIFLASVAPGLFAQSVFAQNYHWRRALPASCRAVAFNPLSKGQILFAGPGRETDGIFRSDDAGATWTLHDTPGLTIPMNNIHQIFCVPGDTSVVLAVSPEELYRSTDGGFNWAIVSDTIGGVDGEDIAWHAADSTLYYGQNFGYALWKSHDLGATWSQTGFANPDSIGLCALDVSSDVPPTIIQGSEGTGLVARSVDDAEHWQVTLHADTGTNNECEVPKVVFSNYAADSVNGRHDVALVIRWLSNDRSLVGTPDGGLTWRTLPSPSIDPWALDVDQRVAKISVPSDAAYPLPLHFFIGLFGVESDTVENGMVQETSNGGATWHSTNFPKGSANSSSTPLVNLVWVLKFDTTTARLAAATDSGIYIADTLTDAVPEQHVVSSLQVMSELGCMIVSSPRPIEHAALFDLLGRAFWNSDWPNGSREIRLPSYNPSQPLLLRVRYLDESSETLLIRSF
jgi:hypothetical protein